MDWLPQSSDLNISVGSQEEKEDAETALIHKTVQSSATCLEQAT